MRNTSLPLQYNLKNNKTMVDINDVIWAFEQGEIEKERLKKSDGAKRDGKGGASS